jgi:hypothetical protein
LEVYVKEISLVENKKEKEKEKEKENMFIFQPCELARNIRQCCKYSNTYLNRIEDFQSNIKLPRQIARRNWNNRFTK